MDPINIALWLILIATIALVPCGCTPAPVDHRAGIAFEPLSQCDEIFFVAHELLVAGRDPVGRQRL
jgi:hypothetical protein